MAELNLYDIDDRFLYDLLKSKRFIKHNGGLYDDGVYIVVDNRNPTPHSRKQKKAAERLYNEGLLERGYGTKYAIAVTANTIRYEDGQHPYLVPDDTQEIVDRGFEAFKKLYPLLVAQKGSNQNSFI